MSSLGPVGVAWLLALATASQPPPDLQGPDAERISKVFEAHRSTIVEPGPHQAEEFLFGCGCVKSGRAEDADSSDLREMAEEAAIESIVDAQFLSSVAALATPGSGKAVVLTRAIQSHGEFRSRLKGATTVHTSDDSERICVVLAIPTPPPLKLDGLLQEVVADLRTRLSSGQDNGLSGPEALLLLELDPKALESPMRESVLDCLDRQVGDGFSATVEGRWSGRSGEPLKNGLEDWCAEAAGGRARDASTWSSMKREQRLRALGHRAGDPGLSRMVAEDLMGDGWGRAAELLKSARPASAVPASSADSVLRPEVRAMALGTPAVMAMVLSDGADPRALSGGRQSSAEFKAATESFNSAKPEGLNEAVERLTQILAKPDGRTADVPSLLSASLTNLGEPALAIPIARAAFRSGRDHRYAGVNLVLALQKAGRREELAVVLPEVEKCPNLDDWGRQQLQAARAWLKP